MGDQARLRARRRASRPALGRVLEARTHRTAPRPSGQTSGKPRTGTHPDFYLECMREKTRVLSALAAMAAGAVLAMAPPASAATTTTTTLVSSANPSTVGQAVTLTATVTGDAPTGQVDLRRLRRPPRQRDLNAGVATLVTSSLTVGDHALTATYFGDGTNDTSFGTLTQTVAAPPPPPPPATPTPPATPAPWPPSSRPRSSSSLRRPRSRWATRCGCAGTARTPTP